MGYKMPVIGLGTWTQDDKTVEMSVYEAIKDGYRLIDTAQYYGNETGVGNGCNGALYLRKKCAITKMLETT